MHALGPTRGKPRPGSRRSGHGSPPRLWKEPRLGPIGTCTPPPPNPAARRPADRWLLTHAAHPRHQPRVPVPIVPQDLAHPSAGNLSGTSLSFLYQHSCQSSGKFLDRRANSDQTLPLTSSQLPLLNKHEQSPPPPLFLPGRRQLLLKGNEIISFSFDPQSCSNEVPRKESCACLTFFATGQTNQMLDFTPAPAHHIPSSNTPGRIPLGLKKKKKSNQLNQFNSSLTCTP